MTWVLLWTVLALGAVAALLVLGQRLWRQGKNLVAELGVATDRLAQVSDRLADLHAEPEPLGAGQDGVRSTGPHRRP